MQKSWWSAKADSLTAEVVRLQTEAAEAEERHLVALQVTSGGHASQLSASLHRILQVHLYMWAKHCTSCWPLGSLQMGSTVRLERGTTIELICKQQLPKHPLLHVSYCCCDSLDSLD